MGFGWRVCGLIFIIRAGFIIIVKLGELVCCKIGLGTCVSLCSMFIWNLGRCSLKIRWIGTLGSIPVTSTVNYPSFCSLVSPSASFSISSP